MATIAERISRAKQDNGKPSASQSFGLSIEDRIQKAKQNNGKTVSSENAAASTVVGTVKNQPAPVQQASVNPEEEAEKARLRALNVDTEDARRQQVVAARDAARERLSQAGSFSFGTTTTIDDPQAGQLRDQRKSMMDEAKATYERLDAEEKRIAQDIKNANRIKTRDSYDALDGSKDFDALSSFNDKNKNALYRYINGIDRDKVTFVVDSENGNSAERYDPYELYSFMSDEDIARYNYLTYTKGSRVADEFLKFLEDDLKKARFESQQKEFREFGQEHKVLGSAGSVLYNIVGGVSGTADVLGRYLLGKEQDAYSDAMSGAVAAQTTRQGVSEDMSPFGRFLYNTGMSVVDSLSASKLPGKAAPSALLASTAFANTAQDIAERGGDENQIVAGSLAAGTFEWLFENISIGNFKNMKEVPVKSLKDFLFNLAKSGGVNATEEGLTELANIIWDTATMGDISQWNIAKQQYIDAGYPPEEAQKQVIKDMVGRVLEAGASGLLMGFGFGTVGSVQSAMQNNTLRVTKQGKQVVEGGGYDALVEQGLGLPTTSQAYQMARGLSNGETKKTDWNVGLLSQAVQQEQAVATAIKGFGTVGRKTFDDIVENTGASPDLIVPVFESAYEMGRNGEEVEMEGLSNIQKMAYNAGQMDELLTEKDAGFVYDTSRSEIVNELQGINAAQVQAAYIAGQEDSAQAEQAVYFGKDAGLDFSDPMLKRANLRSKDRRMLDAVGKVAGVKVRFVDKLTDENGRHANAKYKNGELLIALNTADPVRVAFTHEIVHRMREVSPEAYNALATFVQQNMNSDSMAIVQRAYSDAYGTNPDVLSEEIVAQAIGQMMSDSAVLEQFVKDDRNAAQKLLDAVHDLIAAIKRALNGQNVKLSAEQKADFADLQVNLEEMSKTLESALKQMEADVNRNTKQGNKNTSSDGGEVRYSTKLDVLALNDIDWMDNYSSIKEQLQEHADKLNGMAPVALVDYTPKSASRLSADMMSEIAKIGGKNMKNGGVSFEFDKKGVDSIRAHAKSYELQAAALASPYVAKYGKLIAGQKNHEGFGLTTLTYAAPVIINGEIVNIGLAIQFQANGRPRAVNVGLQSGGVFKIDIKKAPKGLDSRVSRYGQGTSLPTMGAHINSIPSESEKSNTQNAESKNSLVVVRSKAAESLSRELTSIREEGARTGKDAAEIEREVQQAIKRSYESLADEYGAIPAGENPARDVRVPKKTADNQKVSQTVRTILEAKATPDAAVPTIEKLTANGDFSYEVYTDKQAMADAENVIREKGYNSALMEWTKSVQDGEVSKSNTALGWALYNQAANAGDLKTAMSILTNMVGHQRNAAQAVQATRILKKMSPEAQLYGVQRSAQNLAEELEKRYGKDAPDIQVNEELARKYLEAETDKEREEAMRNLYRDLGRQMPSRFIDKWNAWRYLAMLGNPRTHVRNVLGNAFFAPVVFSKDMTATAIESAVSRVSGGKLYRTKGVVGFDRKSRDLLSAAWSDYESVADQVSSGGKYSDFDHSNQYIQEGRRIFKNRALEAARKGNSAALEAEDMWFSRPHYAYALAQYCKANGITAEQMRNGKGLDRARSYAIKEAQKATYRDTNAFSQTISELGRYRGNNKVKKGVGVALEGILPFRKTPANILVRGLEYSPLGLANGIKQAVWDVKRGNKTAADAIDSISAGLTGTGLLALGAFLAAQGLVRGSGGDDEEKNEFEELQGHQAYALELPDGTSVTLDWLSPEVLPFFVGVNLWEQTASKGDGGVTMSDILTATANVTEPLLEMSCLQSLNDVFDAVGYASSDGLSALPSALASAATSYLTQGFPTILGQAERTGEDKRMTTYTEKNAFLTPDMQYTVGRISARLPGLDYQQIPYIDAWGRTENTGNAAARAGNNFLNPAYTSTAETSSMEDELLRLYEQTGDVGVLPSRAAKYFNVDGERKDLTAQEYVNYAQAKGQTAYKVLTALSGSEAYRKMSDAEKVEVVGLVYDYANATAKTKVSGYKPDGWIAKAVKTEKATGVKAEQYVTLYLAQKDIESLKEADGDTIANSKSLLVMEMVYNVKGLTDAQRRALFEDFGVSKTVIHFEKALVAQKLQTMRARAK